MEDRPYAAFILSFVGGLFVVVGTAIGYLLFVSNAYVSVTNLTTAFAGVALSLGVLMVIASLLLYVRPGLHVAWGLLIIVLSAGSFTSVFAGYAGLGLGLIGMVLGISGGAIAIAWHPGVGILGTGAPSMSYRVCLACGRMSAFGYTFCPFCGTPVPAVSPPGSVAPPTR
jgi:Family of unknown function (DUF6114)